MKRIKAWAPYYLKYLSSTLILISLLIFPMKLHAATLNTASGEFYKITETHLGGRAGASDQYEIEQEGAFYSWAVSGLLGQSGVSAGYKYDLGKFLFQNNLPNGKYKLNIKYRRGYTVPKIGYFVSNDFNMVKVITAINGNIINEDELANVHWYDVVLTGVSNGLSIWSSGLESAAKNAKTAQELLDTCVLWGEVDDAKNLVLAISAGKQLYGGFRQLFEFNEQEEINKEINIGAATELNLFSLVNTVSAGIGGNAALCFVTIDEINLTLIEAREVVDIKLPNCEQIPWANGYYINRATTNEIQPEIEIQCPLKQITPVIFHAHLTSLDSYLDVWSSNQTINTDINGYLKYIPDKILLNNEGMYGFYFDVLKNNTWISNGTRFIRDTIKPEITISDKGFGSYHVTVSENYEIVRVVTSFFDLYGDVAKEEKYEDIPSSKLWEKDVAIGNYSGIEVAAFDIAGNSSTKVVFKPPKITVATPTNVEINKTLYISWTSEGIIGSYVKIELSRDGGSSWVTLADSTDAYGPFPWVVSGNTSPNCLIRITSISHPNVTGTSSGTFAILTACYGHDLKADSVSTSRTNMKPTDSTIISANVVNKKSVTENNINVTLSVIGPSYSCSESKTISTLGPTSSQPVSFIWPSETGSCTSMGANGNYTATISVQPSCDENLSDNSGTIGLYVSDTGLPPTHFAYKIRLYEFPSFNSLTNINVDGQNVTVIYKDEGVSNSRTYYTLNIGGVDYDFYEGESYLAYSKKIIIWNYSRISGTFNGRRLIIGTASDIDSLQPYAKTVYQGGTASFSANRSMSTNDSNRFRVSGTEQTSNELTLWILDRPSGIFDISSSLISVDTTGLNPGTYRFAILSGTPQTTSDQYVVFGRFDVISPSYLLNLQKGGTGSGQVKINNGTAQDLPFSQSFTSGQPVKIEAVASGTNSSFVNWTDGINSSANPYNFTITGTKNVTANFKTVYPLSISKTGTGSGQIKVNGVIVSLPYTGAYDADTIVNLEAIENTGSSFVEWTGDQSGSSKDVTITMSGTRSVSANFSLIRTLTGLISPQDSGFMMADGTLLSDSQTKKYLDGQTAHLTAIKSSGYNFINWGGDAGTGSDLSSQVIMNGEKSVIANFAKVLNTPNLLYPPNNEPNQPINVSLEWEDTNNSPQESGYKIRIKPSGGSYTEYSAAQNATSYATSGLSAGVTYYWSVKAFGNGTSTLDSAYPTDRSFTVAGAALNAPTLSSPADGATDQASNVSLTWTDTNSSPQENGYKVRIKPSGGIYIEYSADQDATFYPTSGLIAGVTYYWSIMAVGNGTSTLDSAYPIDRAFRVAEATTVPVVSTGSTSATGPTTATSGGNVSSEGGADVTARGVCWSTSTNPTMADSKTTDGSGAGSFTSSITGLNPNTTYHVRAYATNSVGTAYGDDVTFMTPSSSTVPVVSTGSTSATGPTTATSGGNVTSDGNATVTARGICWSTSSNPTTSNSKTVDGSGTGSFTSSITGLNPGTTYHVRAYATNSAGTAYGSDMTFTTNHINSEIPVFTPYSGNPIRSSYTIPISKVIKLNNEYRGYFVEQNSSGTYPADFKVDVIKSVDGITWGSIQRNIISSQQTSQTFNYNLVELKVGGTYKAWHSATSDRMIAYTKLYYSTSTDGVTYTPHGLVLNNNPYPQYDSRNINNPHVLFDGSTYRLYYSAIAGGEGDWEAATKIAYANSIDGVNWTKQGVVVDIGAAGSFDSQHAHAPTVLFDGSIYEMFYGASDGTTYSTGYAVSTDGLNWQKKGKVTSIDGTVAGVVKENGLYKIWYYKYNDHLHNLYYAEAPAAKDPQKKMIGLPWLQLLLGD